MHDRVSKNRLKPERNAYKLFIEKIIIFEHLNESRTQNPQFPIRYAQLKCYSNVVFCIKC